MQNSVHATPKCVKQTQAGNADMNPRIRGIHGPLKGANFALFDGEVSIGRDSSNQLWAADAGLSRRHCLLIGQGGQFTIRDLGSRNGTTVSGVPVEEHRLRHGDQICVGHSVLVFLSDEDEAVYGSNAVEVTETGPLGFDPVLLRAEDAVYLKPGSLPEGTANAARLAQDLSCLLTISSGIGKIYDRESLEWQLLGMIFDVVPADRAAVLHFSPDSKEMESAVAWDKIRGPGTPVRVSRTVVNRVLQDRIGLLISDVATSPSFGKIETLTQLQVHSVLCVPLLISGSVQSLIYLDSRNLTRSFDESHLQLLTAIASLASLALTNLRHWEAVREENQALRAEISLQHNMVGAGPRMLEVYNVIRRVAPTDSTVLIQGESGTGKELVARAIHCNSPRSTQPLVAINCAALTETLLESELFGHEKGAFTGATAQKKGKLELAQGGTLFLDEVTEMAADLQPKLLRVLQEREFERVGGTRTIKADIRLIAATNRDLGESVAAGAFRKDLYYRLNVVTLSMPPLRERREDIPVLAEYFVHKICGKGNARNKTLSPETLACLTVYDWPGNVRELENAIERALILGNNDVILPEDLPEDVLEASSPGTGSATQYHGALKDTKRQLVLQALHKSNGNYIEAAQLLGVHPNSLLRLIRKLGLKEAAKAGGDNSR
jgi:transcriptional regulator with GAF, ATPase, and Fis domain